MWGVMARSLRFGRGGAGRGVAARRLGAVGEAEQSAGRWAVWAHRHVRSGAGVLRWVVARMRVRLRSEVVFNCRARNELKTARNSSQKLTVSHRSPILYSVNSGLKQATDSLPRNLARQSFGSR